MILCLLVFEDDLSPITVLCVFSVDAVQLQVSESFSEFHIDPAMGKAFSEIVADCRLVNEMEMIPLIMLPLMRVTIEIGLGMLSFGKKFQQGRSITHALDGTHAAVVIRVVVTKDEGWLIRSFVELFGDPVQLFVS